MSKSVERAQKRVEEARKKLQEALEQSKAIERREQARQKVQERKQTERKKYLLGAMLLRRMEQDQQLRAQLLEDLGHFLTRPNDRTLFGLPPKKNGL